MMNYLYEMFAQIVLWFIGVAFDNNQIPDATTSSDHDLVPSALHQARLNQLHERNQANLKLPCVQPPEDSISEDSSAKETSRNEIDNKGESSDSNTVTNNNTEEFEYANIDNSKNCCGYINTLDNAPEGSYAAYLATCDDITKIDNIYLFPSDDDESIQSDDTIFESPPAYQPEIKSKGLTVTNNKNEKSKYTNIDTSNDDHGYLNSSDYAPEGSYAAYLAERGEAPKTQSIYLFSSDDEESIQTDDSILESLPPYHPENKRKGFQTPQFPTLKDIQPTSDFDLALKAGPMPRLCTYCFRWEDQPDDKYEKKDMVSDKWFMIGNIVFFRKLKPFWTQCSACGFGMPKKVVRGRRIHRVKKLFCKMSGREYKGYEFKRFGYEWMSEEGRNEGLSAYM